MSVPLRTALALLPLALYFFVLGVWQSGRNPRLVSGSLDAFLLTVGLGGLLVFGPVGDLAVHWFFPQPNLAAWLAVASGLGLIALYFMARARVRVHVYKVKPKALLVAVERALSRVMVSPTRTLEGFEDTNQRRGVRVESSPRFGTGVVEATGEYPDAMIARLTPILREELSRIDSEPSYMATAMFALACVVAFVPIATGSEIQQTIRWVRSVTGL